MLTPESAVGWVWTIWFVSWLAAARWSGPAVQSLPPRRELLYRALVTAGVILLFGVYPRSTLPEPILYRISIGTGWLLLAIVVLGFLFTWWARIYLGRLWSSTVTTKADHRVIDTGPYAFVRHPIYTGVSTSAIATAVLRGTAYAFCGAAVMIAGWYIKALLEEEFLREQLGRDQYDSYARRVPMLVPFVRVILERFLKF